MRILAIDPGSALGWATDATGRLEWGTEDFHVKRGESSGNRWHRFKEWLLMASLHRDFESARAAAKRGDDLFTRIDLIVYERATFTMPNRAYSDVLAGFYALLEEHCERCDIRLQPVAVQTLKAFALPRVKRKKGDPKMDRGKAAMIAATVHRLSFPVSLPGEDPFDPKVLRGSQDFTRLNALTEHEADALWLYWWAKENCK